MCTSEPVCLESSPAACAARRASSEPSVARRIFVGNILIGVTSLRYAFSLTTMMPSEETPAHPSSGCSPSWGRGGSQVARVASSLEEQPEQVDDRDQDAEDHHGQE